MRLYNVLKWKDVSRKGNIGEKDTVCQERRWGKDRRIVQGSCATIKCACNGTTEAVRRCTAEIEELQPGQTDEIDFLHERFYRELCNGKASTILEQEK